MPPSAVPAVRRLVLRAGFAQLAAPFKQADLAGAAALEPLPATLTPPAVLAGDPSAGAYQPSASEGAGGRTGASSRTSQTSTTFGSWSEPAPPVVDGRKPAPSTGPGAPVEPGLSAQAAYTKSAVLRRLGLGRREL